MEEEPLAGQSVAPTPVAPAPIAPAPQPPAFRVRALLVDVVARYGADPLRLAVVAANLTIITFVLTILEAERTFSTGDPGIVLQVLGAINGAVNTALLVAVAGGGPQTPAGAVLRQGLRRSFRVFITLIAIGITATLVAWVITFAANLFLRGLPLVHDVVGLAAILMAAWLIVRLGLALPAVVIDEQGAAEGLSMARSVTAPRGVWARLAGAAALLAVVFVASFFGVSGLTLLILRTGIGTLAVFVGFWALWTPVAALFLYSADRRLVAPGGVDTMWAEPQVGFEVPPIGRAARVLAFAALGFAVIGLLVFFASLTRIY